MITWMIQLPAMVTSQNDTGTQGGADATPGICYQFWAKSNTYPRPEAIHDSRTLALMIKRPRSADTWIPWGSMETNDIKTQSAHSESPAADFDQVNHPHP